jgi:hypothetical protein
MKHFDVSGVAFHPYTITCIPVSHVTTFRTASLASYAEAKERSSIGSCSRLLNLCLLLHFPTVPCGLYQEAKALVPSEDYHVIIITNSHVNRMARRLVGNVGKYARGGSVAVQRRCDGIQSIRLFFCGFIITKISVECKNDIQDVSRL